MNQIQRKIIILVLIITTPLVGCLAYLMLFSIVVGPFFSDKISAFSSQVFTALLTVITLAMYWKIGLKANSHKRYGERTEKQIAFHKKWLFFLSILAFAMAPFGFAGMLESRGGGMLSPIWGGNLCLGVGFLLLFFSFSS